MQSRLRMKTTITPNLKFTRIAAGAALLAALLAGYQAPAATTGTWKTAGGGNWNTLANWTGGIPKVAGDIANMTGSLAAGKTVTVDTTVVVGTMNLGVTSGTANPYTIAQGAGGTLAFGNGGSTAVLAEKTIAASGDIISSPFALNDNLVI